MEPAGPGSDDGRETLGTNRRAVSASIGGYDGPANSDSAINVVFERYAIVIII